MDKKNIFLTGFMGAGKSTVARCLKEKYGYTVIEMDSRIEENEGMTISEIFAAKGEPYFRALETGFLKSLGQGEGIVVSCGGGVPLRQENVDAMKGRGTVVYLTAEPPTILERVKNDAGRPLLEGHKDVEYIKEMLSVRDPKYRAAADLMVSTDGKEPEAVADEIVAAVL